MGGCQANLRESRSTLLSARQGPGLEFKRIPGKEQLECGPHQQLAHFCLGSTQHVHPTAHLRKLSTWRPAWEKGLGKTHDWQAAQLKPLINSMSPRQVTSPLDLFPPLHGSDNNPAQ